VRYPEFAEMASLAFAPVRHYGSGDPRVVVKLLNTALAVARRVPDNARAVLRHEAELTARAAERALPNEDERAYARGEAERIVKAIAVSLSPAGR
jgi:uncharacterized membrane protein